MAKGLNPFNSRIMFRLEQDTLKQIEAYVLTDDKYKDVSDFCRSAIDEKLNGKVRGITEQDVKAFLSKKSMHKAYKKMMKEKE
jgi:Arc/MetJ-type ribon-helix-helix transcriptional regulator